MRRRQIFSMITAIAAAGMALAVRAQAANYPNRPIKIVVPFTAGSGADSGSRVYGEMLTKVLAINKSLTYDPFKDFRPVHGFGIGVAAFIVKADSPWRTMADVVNAVKREKRVLMVGNYSEGYMLIGAWLGLAAGIQVNHVPYKGGAQLQNDVMAGALEFGINDLGGVFAHIKDGRLRCLATTGAQRDRLVPDVPTMMELGYSDFESYT